MLERLRITKFVVLNMQIICLWANFPNFKTLMNMPLFRTIESEAKAVYVKRGHILKTVTLRIFSDHKR